MLTRRNLVLAAAAVPVLAAGVRASSVVPGSSNGQHSVLMLNADCNDSNIINVFTPAVLDIETGDSVTFLATDAGHNSASKRGMIPDGAKAWNGAMDEDLTVTFPVPGIYGYVCVPHYEVGMVGLIIVGGDLSNLATAKKARHPGDARKIFRTLLSELEARET